MTTTTYCNKSREIIVLRQSYLFLLDDIFLVKKKPSPKNK